MQEHKIDRLGLFVLASASLYVVLGLFSVGVIIPQIAAGFSSHPYTVFLSQMVGALSGFSFAFGDLIVSRATERLGYRPVLSWSSIIFAFAGCFVVILDNIDLILATRIVVGLSVAGALISALWRLCRFGYQKSQHPFSA